MGDDVKIVGNAGKNATVTVNRNCNAPPCTNNSPANKWIFTPVNFKFKAKATFQYNPQGVEEDEALKLTPRGDMGVKHEFMSIVGDIQRGAIDKDAATELRNHYNSIKPQQAPAMTTETSELIVTEWHNELKKSEWKTFFEKGVSNALKIDNMKNEKVMDYASKNYIEKANLEGISYKDWSNHSSTDKEYTVEVNVGVDPVFLKTCSNKENRARLTVSDPVLKECKTFLAGINQENDDLFSFEVKMVYEDDDGFAQGSTLKKVSDAGRFLQSSNRVFAESTTDRLVRQHVEQGLASAAGGSSFVQYDEERQMVNVGGDVGDIRIGVESMIMPNGNNSFEARQDIYVGVVCEFGTDHFAVKRINIGGKKASLYYGLQRVAANCVGWIDQFSKLWRKTKSEGPKVEQNADDLKDKTDEQGDSADEMTDKAGTVQDKASAAAGATSQSDMANKLDGLQSAINDGQNQANDLNAKEQAVRTNDGVSSPTNQANVDKLLPTLSELEQGANQAQNLNNAGDLQGAKQVVTSQVLPKASELIGEATAAQIKAEEQIESAEAWQGIVKTAIDLQASGPRGNEDAKDGMYKDARLDSGSAGESEKNIGKLAQNLESANRSGVDQAVTDMITPALGPIDAATPKETAVNKSNLQGDTPRIVTDKTNGGGEGGEGFKSDTPTPVDPTAISGTVGKTEKEEGQTGADAKSGPGFWSYQGDFNPDAAEIVWKILPPAEANVPLKDSAQNTPPLDSGSCWVAREVYGIDNVKWLIFRHWMLNSASDTFRNFYLKYGERIASFIKNKPSLKRIIKSWMDSKINAK